MSDDNIERVHEAFLQSPHKLEQAGNWTCQKMTVWKVLLKRLCFKPYKMRLVQALTPANKVKMRDFCEEMQLKMEESDFVGRLTFCDEATFHNQWQGEHTECPYLGNRATTCTDRAPA